MSDSPAVRTVQRFIKVMKQQWGCERVSIVLLAALFSSLCLQYNVWRIVVKVRYAYGNL